MHTSIPPCPSAPRRGRRRGSTLVSGLLAGVLSAFGLVPLAAPATAVPLAEVGPVDNEHGYPFWYGDGGNPAADLEPVRLELCLDDPLCPVVGELPDPTKPRSLPENFPDESFWWSAEASIDTASGARARLILAQEAAFGGAGDVAVDQQVAFSRLRIRIDDVAPGATYTVTSPYGVDRVTADDRGRVFVTEDTGCLSPPCGFDQALGGRVGPFLRWDSGAPEGYVGDPAVLHTVVGSPLGTNFFRIEGAGIGGAGVDAVETDLFAVQGRIAQPRATVSLPGDVYAPGATVVIGSSFPGESEILYTTNGSDPLVNGTSWESTADAPDVEVPLPLGPTTLKYAVRYGDQTSEVYTQEYSVRDDLSVVAATPAPAASPAVLEGRQDIALSGSLDGPIYYTTDGTRPRLEAGEPVGTTRVYTAPLTVARNTTVKAISAPAGLEPGPVGVFRYAIHNLREVSAEQTAGYPFTLTDIGSTTPTLAPVQLELCLDDPLCPVVGDLPDPTRGISFPDNFPDESFWWSGEAGFTAGGIDARLVLAAEAAFDSATPQDGHQVAFGRIRVRLDGAVPGATYNIVHPYGVVRATADDTGRLFYTEDTGCMTGPCGFERLLTQPVGPFLRWDPAVGEAAPAGYVGDPTVEHEVVGSPYGTDEFTVEQVTDGDGNALGSAVPVGSTDLFAVQGKVAGPGVTASWQTGTFNHALAVELVGNSLTDEIRYTTDGSDPTTSSPRYTGPIAVGEGATTLKYLGVGSDGATSLVETETYTVDVTAPTVSASPTGGDFTGPQDVTLASDDPAATIRYTLDGSAPGAGSPVYAGGPIRVADSLTLRAVATDAVGNASAVGSWDFTITPPATGGQNQGTPGAAAPTTTAPTTPLATGPTTGATTGPTTGLLLRAPAGAIDAGGTTTLAGVLAPDGQVLADAPVVLQARAVAAGGRLLGGPDWVDVATTVTARDGSYSFGRLRPTATTDYRVVFQGDAAHAPVVSATRRVKVRAVVGLARPDRRVERGARVTFRGELAPAHRGATVVVRLDGPGTRTDKVAATVSRGGTWRVTTRAPHRTGTWKAVAMWRGDGDHVRSTSTTRTFRVLR